MSDIRPIVTQIDGMNFILLEGYRDLFKILSRQPVGGLWDIIAVDKYMITEILSRGKVIELGMVAELKIRAFPQELAGNPEYEVEYVGDRLVIKSFSEYEAVSNMVYYAIATKINRFRAQLRSILIKYRSI